MTSTAFTFFGLALLGLVAAAGPAHADDKATCAVMAFQALAGVNEGLAQLVSEREFGEIGKSGRYQMIERAQAERVLRENQLAVIGLDTTRAIEAGKILAAEYIVIGSVGKIGRLFTVNSRLVSVESGAIVALAATDHEGREEDLLAVAANNARQLLGLPVETIAGSPGFPTPISRRIGGGNVAPEAGADALQPDASALSEIQNRKSKIQNQASPAPPKLGAVIPVELVWVPEGDLVTVAEDNPGLRRVIPMQGFWVGKYEVTQEQWEELMKENPARFKGSRNPVESIGWEEANTYCRRLQATLKDPANNPDLRVRLPTDTEWEYACRAGAATRFNTGQDEPDLARAGWYRGNSGNTTHPVGGKESNRWGLFDTHGNVWEWCDNKSMSRNQRVIKGGSYADRAAKCEPQFRDDRRPGGRSDTIGLRIVVATY